MISTKVTFLSKFPDLLEHSLCAQSPCQLSGFSQLFLVYGLQRLRIKLIESSLVFNNVTFASGTRQRQSAPREKPCRELPGKGYAAKKQSLHASQSAVLTFSATWWPAARRN